VDRPDNAIEIAAHVAAISARTDVETGRITHALTRRCWPGGVADRRDPAAVEWVRRWAPATVNGAELNCSCAAGRCAVCN
jgi:hypothetical protein